MLESYWHEYQSTWMEDLCQCHFVNHISHLDCLGVEPNTPQWDTSCMCWKIIWLTNTEFLAVGLIFWSSEVSSAAFCPLSVLFFEHNMTESRISVILSSDVHTITPFIVPVHNTLRVPAVNKSSVQGRCFQLYTLGATVRTESVL